jgi:predicted DNA-binding protein with PD1-like motif
MTNKKKIEGMEPRFCEKVDLSEVYFMRFQPHDEIMEKIKEFCKANDIERAVILSGIGSVYDAAFIDPKSGAEIPIEREKHLNVVEEWGPFELQTLEGNLVPLHGEFRDMKHGDLVPHIHATLGTRYGEITGGHLIRAKVFTTTEIFIAKIKGSKVKKKQSSVTALAEMRADL